MSPQKRQISTSCTSYCSQNAIILQVLTFLLTDRKAKNSNKEVTPWICILPSAFKAHLNKKGVTTNPGNFFDKLPSIYKSSYKKPTPHLFLSETSTLTRIPTGDKWRSSPKCVYARACMIERAALSPDTLAILDKGNTNCHIPVLTLSYALQQQSLRRPELHIYFLQPQHQGLRG